MDKLDSEFNEKSSKLTRKVADIEEEIEKLKNDTDIQEKYSSLITELEDMLEDLRTDWNIDNLYTNNKIIEKLNNVSWTELFTTNRELFFNIYNNFNNPNIITSEVKNLFRQKFLEYAKTWGYDFKEWTEIQIRKSNVEWVWLKEYFYIKQEDLTKAPESYNWNLETWLAGYFW